MKLAELTFKCSTSSSEWLLDFFPLGFASQAAYDLLLLRKGRLVLQKNFCYYNTMSSLVPAPYLLLYQQYFQVKPLDLPSAQPQNIYKTFSECQRWPEKADTQSQSRLAAYLESQCSYSSPAAASWPPPPPPLPPPHGGNKADSALQLLRWPEMDTRCSWPDRAPDTPDRSCRSPRKRGLNPNEGPEKRTATEETTCPDTQQQQQSHLTTADSVLLKTCKTSISKSSLKSLRDALPFSLIN